MFHFDIQGLRDKSLDLEQQSYEEDFWKDIDKAQNIMQEIKALKNQVKEYDDLMKDIEELEVLMDLVLEEEAYDMYTDVEAVSYTHLRKMVT